MRQDELPAPTSRVLSASPAPQCHALAAPSRGAVGEAATLRCEERSRDIRGIFRKTKCNCNYRVETSNTSPRICSQTAVMQALQEEEEGALARGDHKTSTRTLHKVSWMPVFVLFRNQVAWILTFIAWILLFFFISREFLGAWGTALHIILGSILFILIPSSRALVQIQLDSKGSWQQVS